MMYKMSDGNVFYHVPKTGGRAYKAYAGKEAGATEQPRITGNPNTGHAVANRHPEGKIVRVVIRDPVDRFLSAYYFTQRCSKSGPHKNTGAILKVKKYGWQDNPYEMCKKILNSGVNDIDKLKFFHFNTQYSWHKKLNPSKVEYIDFRDLNFKKRLGKAPPRKSTDDESSLNEIIDSVRVLYKKDYDYFQSISKIENITSTWM